MSKRVVILVLSVFAIYACSKKDSSEKGKGYLSLNIIQGTVLKTGVEESEFILRISDGNNEVLKGRINELPGQIVLPARSYTVEAYSTDFSEPKYEMPFYYGKTTVEIEPDETNEVSIVCSQGNAGVKIVWSNDFLMYETYYAQINSDNGYLHYSSTETQTGYFLPGTVSISIMADGQNIDGGTITLYAQDMVTANMQLKSIKSGELTFDISIDNSLNEREVDIIIDPDNIAFLPNSETNPYTIAQAIERFTPGDIVSDVWVSGYIVGARPSSGTDFLNRATWQRTNIVLADEISETNENNCIFVELPSTGNFRADLCLPDDEDRLHKKVLIKGNLRTYFTTRAGLRDITNYSFID